MSGQTIGRLIVAGMVAAAISVPLAVILGGGTFGARCAHAYPTSGLQQERCIDRMSKGGSL